MPNLLTRIARMPRVIFGSRNDRLLKRYSKTVREINAFEPAIAALSDAELWELARAGKWSRLEAGRQIVRENEPGDSFFLLAQGQVKVTRQNRLLNLVNESECFGEMAYIRGGSLPRHATVEAMNALLVAEFVPQALSEMSLGAQLQLTRALVRNLVDRLELANSRLVR